MLFGTLVTVLLLGAQVVAAPSVVATTSFVGDIVRQIGGDEIQLTVLFPLGADPHAFEPTPADAVLLARAAVVFAVGLGLEEGLQPLLATTGARVVELAEFVPLLEWHGHHHGHHHDTHHHHDEDHDHHDDHHHVDPHHDDDDDRDHDDDHHGHGAHPHHDKDHDHHDDHHHVDVHHDYHHGEYDPHVWLDPTRVALWTHVIADVLADLAPEHAALFASRAAAYREDLAQLDRWIVDQVRRISEGNRVLVTDHEELGYFAHRYGFRVAGTVFPGLSPLAEPAARELAELVATIRALGVRAIFVSYTVNPQLSEQVARDTGARIVFLYTHTLSAATGPASTYLDMMRYNVRAIAEVLGE